MTEFNFFLLLTLVAGTWASPFFFVLGPNAFRFNHEEQVFVSIVDASDQQIEVWLEYDERVFSKKVVNVPSEDKPQVVAMKVTSGDIFPDGVERIPSQKPKHVKLIAKGMDIKKESQVMVNYNSGFLIIQLDKPLYSPGQSVNYRVLALDEEQKRNKDVQLVIDIKDAINRTIRRTKPQASMDKIFSDRYTIPNNADLGLWTVRAFYMGEYSTEARVTFKVDEYEIPTFGAEVTINARYIEPDTKTFTVDVEAKYVYGKPVDGNVGLRMFLRHDDTFYREFVMRMDSRLLQNGKKEFTINTTTLLASNKMPQDVRDKGFPGDGYSLEVVADVFEYTTGFEEIGTATVIFTERPYRFSFLKSKPTYNPLYLYTLQLEILYANEELVKNGTVDIEMYRQTENQRFHLNGSLKGGKMVLSCETTAVVQDLQFKATFEGKTSETFVVKPYTATAQMRIEIAEKFGKVHFDINGDAAANLQTSKLTMMVISRGRIEWMSQSDGKREVSEVLEENLLQRVAPTARAFAFYVIKSTGEVISDSMQFEITPKCRGKGLTLKTRPGDRFSPGVGDLFIEGEPLMHVGMNAMDKALLLLHRDNSLLKQNQMFKLLAQHDVGCGPGGGLNSQAVFKGAGICVVTNAGLQSLVRESITCDDKSRRKRAIDCPASVHEDCCAQGVEYAMFLLDEKEQMEIVNPNLHVDVISKCLGKRNQLLKNKHLPAQCVEAFHRSCIEALVEYDEDLSVSGKSSEDLSDYEKDIRNWNEGKNVKVRDAFKESWLFQDIQLPETGQQQLIMNLPDSITTWYIQAVGFSNSTGVCIAEPIDIISFKEFFIQLELPYSAVRLENVNIKVSVFNYLPSELTVHTYLEGQKGLCSSARAGQKSSKLEADVAGNNATSFDFLVLPLLAQEHTIEVVTFGRTKNGITYSDAVRKKLLVVNEGKEVMKTIKVCLDPLNAQETCEDSPEVVFVPQAQVRGQKIVTVVLTPPKDAIPGTAQATGYIKSNIMTDIVKATIEGTENKINMPWGCGEQTMIGLAPTVYAVSYLKQTGQMTKTIEDNGNRFIRAGVERELGFRHDDFAYAAWKQRTASTWLTAFVMKVFCQAKKAADNAVDTDEDIVPTLKYLAGKHDEGRFYDPLPVIHREMTGQINFNDNTDPSLTAFVITGTLECDARPAELNESITKAVKYLEEKVPRKLYEDNPYLLAITTYALGLAKSNSRWDFMDMLQKKARKDGKKMFWGEPGGQPASANAVETTSYAALAYLNFGLVEESTPIIRWLMQQRQSGGSFRSTQDTVVGLQALAEYTVQTFTTDVNITAAITVPKELPRNIKVTSENAQVMEVIPMLHPGNGQVNLTMDIRGHGSAFMDIDFRYNVESKEMQCTVNLENIEIEDISGKLELSDEVAKQRGCDVCQKCEQDENPDYRLDNFQGLEPEPEVGSKILRQKRSSGEGVVDRKKHCVRFDVSSDKESDMAIVSFGLQTGVNVEKRDLDKMIEENVIDSYETPADGKSYIIFYLDKLAPNPKNFTFRIYDDFKGDRNSRQMAKVDLYEYYNPDRSCTKFYDLGAKFGKPFEYQCSAPMSSNCHCLQNECATDFRKKIANELRNPILFLRDRICNTDKADLAVKVRIVSISNDDYFVKATGLVLRVMHPGVQNLEENQTEMSFRYRLFCPFPNLEEGQVYYIITKNGFNVGENQYEYELMDTSIVIKEPPGNGNLKKIFQKFGKEMRKGCHT